MKKSRNKGLPGDAGHCAELGCISQALYAGNSVEDLAGSSERIYHGAAAPDGSYNVINVVHMTAVVAVFAHQQSTR